jgi:transcriptional regulator with AAA-type ATPase domain
VQHVLLIPPLRETAEDRLSDWENIWKQLKFRGNPKVPDEKELIKWLKNLPLYGNYRDLQKIAIYYNIFNQFDDETKEMINEKNAFQYAKSEFQKYHSPHVQVENEMYNFNLNQTTKELIADYQFELQKWAVNKFKSRNAAILHFRQLGDSVAPETFNNWKNKDSIKNKKKLKGE